MLESLARKIDTWGRNAGDWLRRAEGWQLALVAIVALVIVLPAVPAMLSVALIAAAVLFARAWAREFGTLMRLDDRDFPGQHDKLIWALLLIVLPPVGLWLFPRYREARWPQAKPKAARADAVDF